MLPHSPVYRNGCFPKSKLGNSYSLRFSTNRKPAVNSILLLLFHDVVSAAREQHAQQALTQVAVSVRIFRAVAMRLYAGKSSFVYFSARNLTLSVPFLVAKCPPCRKKSILAEVCFDAKWGWYAHAAK